MGFEPAFSCTLCCPPPTSSPARPSSSDAHRLFPQRLSKQLEDLGVPFVDDFNVAIQQTDHIVDAIFGRYSLSPSESS